jgi:hypothetical protein
MSLTLPFNCAAALGAAALQPYREFWQSVSAHLGWVRPEIKFLATAVGLFPGGWVVVRLRPSSVQPQVGRDDTNYPYRIIKIDRVIFSNGQRRAAGRCTLHAEHSSCTATISHSMSLTDGQRCPPTAGNVAHCCPLLPTHSAVVVGPILG